MGASETLAMPMQTFLQAGLGTLVGEVLDGVMISDYDIQAFRQAKSKKDVAKIALVRGLGKLTSAATLGAIHAGDIENYQKTGSLKQTLLKKNLVDLALTGAAMALPGMALATATLRRVLPEFTVEDAGKKAQQIHRAAKRRFGADTNDTGEGASMPSSGGPRPMPQQTGGQSGGAMGISPMGGTTLGAGGALAMQGINKRVFDRERLQSVRQRTAAIGNTPSLDDPADVNEDAEGQEGGEGVEDKGRARSDKARLNAERKKAKDYRAYVKKQIRVRSKIVAKKVAGRAGVRLVNALFGATGIGLIVTFLIMAFQGFAGNLVGAKGVTKLTNIEIGILLILAALMGLLYLLIMSVGTVLSDPLAVAAGTFKDALESLFTSE